jgi:hypothetical protein
MAKISLIEKALEKTLHQNSKTLLDLSEDIQDLESIQNFEKSPSGTIPWEQAKKDLDI